MFIIFHIINLVKCFTKISKIQDRIKDWIQNFSNSIPILHVLGEHSYDYDIMADQPTRRFSRKIWIKYKNIHFAENKNFKSYSTSFMNLNVNSHFRKIQWNYPICIISNNMLPILSKFSRTRNVAQSSIQFSQLCLSLNFVAA